MKRLILMGGRPWEARDGGEYFVKVLFRYFPKNVKLAYCIFAQPESDWEATVGRNSRMFGKFSNPPDITHKIMTADNFKEVSKWADVIYIPGGDPFSLIEKINRIGNVDKLWDGKLIAGSSAGADLFCTHFVYLHKRAIGEGLGWIPATCIPHWRDKFEDYTDKDWDWAEKELVKNYTEMPVLCIPEGEFIELSIG